MANSTYSLSTADISDYIIQEESIFTRTSSVTLYQPEKTTSGNIKTRKSENWFITHVEHGFGPAHSEGPVSPLSIQNILQNHRNTLWEKRIMEFLCSLWETDTMCDIGLQCSNAQLKAHRVVLAANSERLARAFKKNCKDGDLVLDLRKFDSKTVQDILKFLYKSDICITEENVENILKCSVRLRISKLVQNCILFISKHWNINNALKYYAICTNCNVTSLGRQIWCSICNNFEAVCNSQDFLETSIIVILTLFNEDELSVASEITVFNAAIRWLRHDKSRFPLAPAVLDTVRLPMMNPDEIVQLEQNEFFRSQPDFYIRLYDAMRYHSLNGAKSPLAATYACKPRSGYVRPGKSLQDVSTASSSKLVMEETDTESTKSSSAQISKPTADKMVNLEDSLNQLLASLIAETRAMQAKKEKNISDSLQVGVGLKYVVFAVPMKGLTVVWLPDERSLPAESFSRNGTGDR